MRTTNPATKYDGYKCDHRRQYPSNSQLVFSNLTARGTRVAGLDKVILFGLQYFTKEYLINDWNENFFQKDVEEVVKKYNRRLNNYLGPNQIGDQHIRDLHTLGYLPLEIWSLPEGSNVDLRVPSFVVWNTDARFFWLTNAIETILSTTIWGPCTSATTAVMYRKIFEKWAKQTAPEAIGFVPWQGHDFSFRGHFGLEAATMSGAAHLLAFTGTDTVPAIDFLEDYYNADSDKELVGGSVSATEHSVMCMGGMEDEIETFRRLIEDVYPNGIVSIVSDTWDFWNVVDPTGGILTKLKDKVLARDGKVVIRPDSGDPVKIVTGYTEDEIIRQEDADGVVRIYERKSAQHEGPNGGFWEHFETGNELTENEVKGLIQCLWEIFGGTESTTGFKLLDSHIGAIYGDSITLERAEQICQRLADKGFASTNVVFGIGSFTYQGAVTKDAIVTRDTHMFAVKSTYGEVLVEGERKGVEIFKDPKTDSGMKKSAKGLTAVYEKDGHFIMKDQATWQEVKNCAFVQVFCNGNITKDWTLAEVRAKVAENF
jgi:nicotinamide phosphoribosyltransferase